MTAVLLAALLSAAGCAAPLSPGRAATTTTMATASASAPASAGPGVQASFETGVPDAVISFTDGLPTEAGDLDGTHDVVLRDPDGDLLVITWGSTTCPRMPVSVTARDLATIEVVTGSVRIDPTGASAYVSETSLCTVDLGPTVSTVRLPEGAAGSGALTVVVDGVPHLVA